MRNKTDSGSRAGFWLQRIVRNIYSFKTVTSVKAVGKYCPHFALTDWALRLDTRTSHHFAQPTCSCSFISCETPLFLRLYGLSECIINSVLPSNKGTSSFSLYIMECLSWDHHLKRSRWYVEFHGGARCVRTETFAV